MTEYNHTPSTKTSDRNTYPGDNLNNVIVINTANKTKTPELIRRLCQALEEEEITYCSWKSYIPALESSIIGDSDLDLLVMRADIHRFIAILCRQGFKQAQASSEKQIPGVLDYFGYDEEVDRTIHIHVHSQLILGRDMIKNYRLPIERQYLESSVQGDLFQVPGIEFEYIVFVIRRVLKHSTLETILWGEGNLKSSKREELAYLQARINQTRVDDILKRHLPYIGIELFNKCIHAMQAECSIWARVKTGQKLQSRLQPHSRHLTPMYAYLKLWRRAALTIRQRLFKTSFKYRLASGGAMVAIVGGDGAGKSTAVDGLYAWLSNDFKTARIHLGKPAWSLTTITIRAILKLGNLFRLYPADSSFQETLIQKSLVSPGYPWLLRELCRARDRHRTYMKARRIAARGGVVILDRFPLSEIKLMDGPQANRFIFALMAGPQSNRFMSPHPASLFAKALIRLEESYYKQIVLPELVVALRVDPEIAVRRKIDEDADSVRKRSTEIWQLDWKHTDIHLIDASKSKTEVLTELKALLWSGL